jgi:hypothetical protein
MAPSATEHYQCTNPKYQFIKNLYLVFPIDMSHFVFEKSTAMENNLSDFLRLSQLYLFSSCSIYRSYFLRMSAFEE